MITIKGGSPKGRAIALAAAISAVGLVVPAAQAQSLYDLHGDFGNTIQVNAGGDVVQPQFALWPLTGPNSTDIHFESNDATGRGAEPTKPVLLDFGAGNILQLSEGGNVFSPQVAVGTDNNAVIRTFGNYATNNGTDQSVTGGQILGHVVDANGNVFQLEFFQGNVVNPQFAVMGDNTADILTSGNVANGNGGNTSGLAVVDAQGNVVQVMILSHNVINPQVSAGGSNDLTVTSAGNVATDNGGSVVGLAGVFTITKVGNVTQIALLSNNVWAPQVVLPGLDGKGGSNTSDITTDTNDADSSGSTVDLPNGSGGGPIGVGNIHQTAAGDGIIDNPQFNLFHTASTPDVVNEEPPADNPPPDDPPANEQGVVTQSFMAVPGVTGNANSTTSNHPLGNWKPGDGIKHVVAGLQKVASDIHNALHPPKPADSAPSSDTPAS